MIICLTWIALVCAVFALTYASFVAGDYHGLSRRDMRNEEKLAELEEDRAQLVFIKQEAEVKLANKGHPKLESQIAQLKLEKHELFLSDRAKGVQILDLKAEIRRNGPIEAASKACLEVLGRGDGLDVATSMANVFLNAQVMYREWLSNPSSRLNHLSSDVLLRCLGMTRRAKYHALEVALSEHEDGKS